MAGRKFRSGRHKIIASQFEAGFWPESLRQVYLRQAA
jgi:hypothetical protein